MDTGRQVVLKTLPVFILMLLVGSNIQAQVIKVSPRAISDTVVKLKPANYLLKNVNVHGRSPRFSDLRLTTQTVGTSIYAGKKNELIDLNILPANTAINSSRQIYAKIPGVNIIENDEAGVQLGIATRGLNPNRTTEFNSRQNGYDIAADPIGYPETYYTPPADALDQIEIIRGAASLQYGTQFGGLLNFKFKKGPLDKPFELLTRQTGGSYGFFNSFNSLGGQVGKLNYYTFYNYKRSDGWRENTGFKVHNAFISLKYAFSPKLSLGFDYTFMYYTMKQPGGLTLKQFQDNPQQSLRNRNWFSALWNIPALSLDYAIDSSNLLSIKTYALLANRKNVGNLDPINQTDMSFKPRTVMNDEYRNYYAEARFIHHYELMTRLRSSLLTGLRFYHGNTRRMQGYNYTGSDANYSIREDRSELNYRFPSYNMAAFAENVFQLSNRFSITPGLRFEYIQTNSKGYTVADTSSNIQTAGNEKHSRKFLLMGVGLDYKVTQKSDAYMNFSQNYSPIDFGDIVILQQGMRVDPALKDVKGYNFDLGYRGQFINALMLDLSGYYLLYKNRIGSMLQTNGGGDVYLYETNISDSRSAGLELYGELNLLHLTPNHKYDENKLSLFASLSYTDAKYINVPAERKQFYKKKVEYAPHWIGRYGAEFMFKNFSGSLQYSYTDAEFSDATNALESVNGSIGLIPAYHTLDFTMSYALKSWKFSFSANNFSNEKYFTRRTTGFPGPGIIPSEGRAFYGTLQFKMP